MVKVQTERGTGTVRPNQIKNSPLNFVDEMKKQPRGTCDVLVDSKSNVTLVRWKGNKVVTVASTVFGEKPVKKKQNASPKTEVVE